MPNDYRRVPKPRRGCDSKGLSPEDAEMAAFEENARDEARAGGNYMGKPTGFLDFAREPMNDRPELERIRDWEMIHLP